MDFADGQRIETAWESVGMMGWVESKGAGVVELEFLYLMLMMRLREPMETLYSTYSSFIYSGGAHVCMSLYLAPPFLSFLAYKDRSLLYNNYNNLPPCPLSSRPELRIYKTSLPTPSHLHLPLSSSSSTLKHLRRTNIHATPPRPLDQTHGEPQRPINMIQSKPRQRIPNFICSIFPCQKVREKC